MKLRKALVATLLPAILVSAGCTTAVPEPNSTTAGREYTDPPLPPDASITRIDPAVSSAPPPNCGVPTASLRPVGDVTHGRRLDLIRARGHLLVGLDSGSNLFSFRDPNTGTIQGFDVDIAKEVARDLLGNPERIEYRMLGSAQRIESLENHEVDIIVKTMSITCERKERVAFSTEYFRANQRVLAMRPADTNGTGRDVPVINSLADLAGKRVCVAKGTTSLMNIARLQPSIAILAVPTWADCLVALQQRQVDAVSTDDSLLAGLAQQDPYLQIVGPSLNTEPYGVGIAKDDTDLIRFVNRTLERIRRDGSWNRIYQRWLSILGPSPGPPEPHYQD